MSSVRSKVEIGEWGARYYDILLNLLSVGRYSHFVKEVIEKMDIKPGQSILDLGSGTGRNDCPMAQKMGSQGKIVGLDISDEMLSRARKRCRKYPNVTFEKQRIELSLAYEEEFDKVFISFTLHGFEDNQKAGIIRNAYQALKPEGTFCVLDYAEFDIDRMWFPLPWAFARWECQLAVEFLKLDIKEMADTLSEYGKSILAAIAPPFGEFTCYAPWSKERLSKYREEIEECDAILMMACGDGLQVVREFVLEDEFGLVKPIYPSNDAIGHMGGGPSKFREKCMQCGECLLGQFAGICPMTQCAKGLLNGPCGGASNGKCEADPERDCAWELIYERLKKLGALGTLKEFVPPKDYSKMARPRKIEVAPLVL